MATEEKVKKKPVFQRVGETTIGDLLGWTKPVAMAVGYLVVPAGLGILAVGYVERDYIESAVEDYARPAIEAQAAKDGRLIPKKDTCLRYSADSKGEHITVSDACKGTLSLDLVVSGSGTAKTVTLNTGDYKVEGTQAVLPTISQKVPETYQPLQ
ncbi:hypothetical protein HZA99_02070 [Candidatus Woesearchaeota archaeon]|nr:hypothetical protein [Candidatus Woesearchaeota archaeon]